MTRCLVTGAAGFIGSHLCSALMAQKHQVIGVDAFIPFYPRATKEHNLQPLRATPDFTFVELDLRVDDLAPHLVDVDVVIHLAAMPGLPRSWTDFDLYNTCNVQATQRLLEAARAHSIKHFIQGSTSSVYGRFAERDEQATPAPVSPYGVTKLAAEHLCESYADAFGLPLTIIRFFSVYGPRQRPDMAYNIFIRSLLNGTPITIFGDGQQSRSNTYIADCVQGIMRVVEQPERSIGQIFNLGGGQIVTMNDVLTMLAEFTQRRPEVQHAPARVGDQQSTAANIDKIRRVLGYAPTTTVADGLQAQIAWQRDGKSAANQSSG